MHWLELAVASHYPEFVEELLLAAGAQAIRLLDGGDDPLLEPPPGATPLWPHTVTVGVFDATADLAAIESAVRVQLPPDPTLAFETRQVEDRDWIRAWLAHATPLRFGRHLWIRPGNQPIDDDDAIVVDLDPGLAFGTGTHPSTALCLDWLASTQITGKTVIDYGCGSGILGIAALKLGAAKVLATDIDPQALEATAENARRNGVATRMQACAADALPSASADIVLANILAGPLIVLAPQLAQRLHPDGQLVLAGLLRRQAAEVEAAYADAIDFSKPGEREGWVRLNGRRRRD